MDKSGCDNSRGQRRQGSKQGPRKEADGRGLDCCYHAAEARLLWQQGSGWQVEGWGAALEAGVPVGMYRSDIGSRGSLSMRPTEACGPAGVGSEGAARHREVSG